VEEGSMGYGIGTRKEELGTRDREKLDTKNRKLVF